MKKFLALLCAMAMILAIAACGSKTGEPVTPEEPKMTGTETAPAELTEYPFKNMTVIVPFKAGAALDNGCRLFCQYWEKHSGIHFVVENYPGANGQVGVSQFLASPDDGSYLLWSPQPFLSSNIAVQGAEFKLEDLTLLNYHEIDPACLAVTADSQYKTFEDLEAAVKANPGQIKIGVSAGGGAAIMCALMIEQQGWDVKQIVYDGGTELRTALLGGHIDAEVSLTEGCIQNGDNVLLICASGRNAILPDTPTVSEKLGADFPTSLGTYRYVAVHTSLYEAHPEYYDFLLKTMESVYNDPDYQQALVENQTASFISFVGPETATRMQYEFDGLVQKYKDVIAGV